MASKLLEDKTTVEGKGGEEGEGKGKRQAKARKGKGEGEGKVNKGEGKHGLGCRECRCSVGGFLGCNDAEYARWLAKRKGRCQGSPRGPGMRYQTGRL